jgi:hypothetical protein
MATNRTKAELDALRDELERRVRNGESRAEAARDLGIEQSTASNWALEGGWRRKDLAADRAEELAEAMKSVRESRPDAAPERIAIAVTEALMDQGRLDEADRAARFSNRLIQALDRIDEREARRRGESGRRGEAGRREQEPWRGDEDYPGIPDTAEEFHQKLDAMMAELDAEDELERAETEEANTRVRADWNAIVASGVCPCCRGSLSRPGAQPPPLQVTWPLEVEDEEARFPESSNDLPGNSGVDASSIGGVSNEAP